MSLSFWMNILLSTVGRLCPAVASRTAKQKAAVATLETIFPWSVLIRSDLLAFATITECCKTVWQKLWPVLEDSGRFWIEGCLIYTTRATILKILNLVNSKILLIPLIPKALPSSWWWLHCLQISPGCWIRRPQYEAPNWQTLAIGQLFDVCSACY